MIWQLPGSLLMGLALAWLAARLWPRRFPSPPLLLSTGAAAAVFGALLAHTVLGSGHPVATLGVTLVVAVTLLSLLVRPEQRAKHRSTTVLGVLADSSWPPVDGLGAASGVRGRLPGAR